MSPWIAAVIVVGATAAVVAATVGLRRTAPAGGRFRDSSRAAGLFVVLGVAFAVLAGVALLHALDGRRAAQRDAADEATAVLEQFQASTLFRPLDRQTRIQGELVCYARAVVGQEWPAMKDGRSSPVVDHWVEALQRDLAATTPRGDVAIQQWLERASARDEARQGRLLGAGGVVPSFLWALLILAAVAVVAFLLFLADPAERLGQLLAAGGVTAVVVTTLLATAALAAPFADAGARVGPGAMRDTLRVIQDEVEQLGTPVSPRCDDEGRPGP